MPTSSPPRWKARISGTAASVSPKHCHQSVNHSHDWKSASAFERWRSLLQAASLASHSAMLHFCSVSGALHAGPLKTTFPLRIIYPPAKSLQCYGGRVLTGEIGESTGAAAIVPPPAPIRAQEAITPI